MFVFSVYRDEQITQRLIEDLRTHHPLEKLLCAADGEIREDFAEFCRSRGVIFLPFRDRLKLPEFGGLWLERLFTSALLYSDDSYFIKTEGDTRFWRPFKSLPIADVAGTLNTCREIPFPRGGCVFLKRKALEKILNSGILQDDRYCNNPKFSYRRYDEYRYEGEAIDTQPVLLADRVLGDVIHRLGLSLTDWSEVAIEFRGTPSSRSFAATHPHHD
jgi:Zn-finger nucleic acid-binding protein